jgi:hypothetical protein
VACNILKRCQLDPLTRTSFQRLTPWVRQDLPQLMKWTTCAREQDPDGNSCGTNKHHDRHNQPVYPPHTRDAQKQKTHVEFQCPDESNIGIPSDHEPFRSRLTQGRLFWGKGQPLLHGQVRGVAGTTDYVRCYRHDGVACLRMLG